MSRELPDRRRRFFGREQDVAALMARVAKPGLTAVVGRPQIGKSWLLNEVARRLAQDEPRRLVGIAESKGETPDLLLRAIEDLYARWLEDAGARQQAKMVWEQQQKNLLPAVAKAVSAIFTVAEVAAKPVATAVKEGLDGLLAANRDLTTGGLRLPVLQYDQARDLLRAVHGVTGTPLVLILDQWEKSPDVGTEAKTLDSFVRYIDEWPPCHIVLALPPDEPAAGVAKGLAVHRPGIAKTIDLEEMHLDEGEAHRLATWVRSTVPAAAGEHHEALLSEVDGFPGVLMRWHDQRHDLRTSADLERLAKDAHAYRFRELEESLRTLDGDLRRLAIRLVLLPQGSGELWPAIKDEVLDGLAEALLDDLGDGVLVGQDPPDFGHAKRFEVARAVLFAQRPTVCRDEAERLILACGSRIRRVEPESLPFALVLREHVQLGATLRTSDLARAACDAATTLFGEPVPPGPLDRTAGLINGRTDIALLLAMGLVNTVNGAKAEDDLPRRDALLDELRALADARPNEAPVREHFAKGLFSTLVHAKEEDDLSRRDALLDALRALATAHPDNATVGELLAMGLVNTVNGAKAEDDLPRRDALLDELRALADARPNEAPVREHFAKGLFSTLVHAKEEDDLSRRDALLDELRALATAHPDDAPVRELLAIGLVSTLNHAKAEDDLPRREALLDELRALAETHLEDATVSEWLAKGLVNTLVYAKEEDDLSRRDALLDELRALATAHPDDATVREPLAAGLFNTLNHVRSEDDLARRGDALLDELRALAKAHPDDATVREWFAVGLFNTLVHAEVEDDLPRRDGLLDELRALAKAHPNDATVREPLAKGLFNTLNHAKEEDDLARRDALLDELRALASAYPDDAAVRERLAMGLFNTLVHAEVEDDLARRGDALLDELRALAKAHPNDATVREPLAKGLFNTLNHAKEEDDLARRDALLDELRALATAHPDDAPVREQLAMGLGKSMLDADEEGSADRSAELREQLEALADAHPDDGWVAQFRNARLI